MRLVSKLLAAATPLAIVALAFVPASASADDTPECNINNAGPDGLVGTEDDWNGNLECGSSRAREGNGNTAVGMISGAEGSFNTAVGTNSLADGEANTAVGAAALAIGSGSTALGLDATANGASSIALGSYTAAVFGDRNSAIGANSQVFGSSSSAFGEGSLTGRAFPVPGGFGYFLNDRNTALGANAEAGTTAQGQNDATAVGYGAQANVLGGLALGANSRATADNAVALGHGSIADRAGSVSVGIAGGERQIVHVAAGTQATDAVNLGQLDAVAANVASAQTRADAAFANAATAQATADRARTEAAEAMAAANTGIGDAAAARTRADEAFAEAVNAQATANTARTEAFAAQETADTARREAAAAQATGNLARTEAAAAQATADMAVAANIRQDGELGAVRAVNARHDDELIAVRTVNTRQDGEIATARETAGAAILRSDALGAGTAAALGGGSAYDTATGRLSAPAYGIGGRSYDNAGSAFAAVDDRLVQIDGRIDGVIDLSQRVRKEARRGIAAAVSLSPAPFPSAPGRTSYSVNTAIYRGEAAFSASIAHRLDVAAPFAVTGGFGFAGGRDLTVRVGAAGEF